jgi:hypothetical protein
VVCIDCGIGETRFLPLNDVTFAQIGRYVRCRQVAEERLQMLEPAIFKIIDRRVVVNSVVLEHICIQLGKHYSTGIGLYELAHFEFCLPEFSKRRGFPWRVRLG